MMPRNAALAAAAVTASVVVAALVGARGPRTIRLDLGPGDAPYVSGFSPYYEIHEGVGLHWTTRSAAVALPLLVRGGTVAVGYRFGPPPIAPGGQAQIAVSLGGAAVDIFAIGRTEMFQERLTPAVAVASPTAARIAFQVENADPRPLGLWLDWVRLDLGPESEVALMGAARFRPAVVVLLVFVLLLVAGWTPGRAALATLPVSVAATVALRYDPWLVHELLAGVPEGLGLYGFALAAAVVVLRRRDAPEKDVRIVATLVLFAFLLRALAVNTPGFYHPDLRSHVQLALLLRDAGFDFLRSPARYLATIAVWYKPAFGATAAFPYSPAFHVPFAVSALGYDTLLTAVKLAGAALTTIPIALVWALARRLGASVLGAVLLLFFPIYGRHLAVAYMPALFGHAVDLAFVLWLAARLDRPLAPREWGTAAALVTACELAYVSGVVSVPVFVAALALVLALGRGPERVRRAAAILGFGLAGSVLAVLVYYRDFLGLAFRAAGHVAAGGSDAAVEPRPGLAAVVLAITTGHFDPIVLALAASGLVLLFRRGPGRALLAAWLLSYATLLAGRAFLPDLLQHQHEALWLAPLVGVAAGEALAWVAGRGRAGTAVAAVLFVVLAATGLWTQAQDIAGQLGYAR
jgi:hypothetical protein